MENDNNDNLVQPKKRSLPKIVFVILALILTGEAIFAVKTLSQPTPAPLSKTKEISTTTIISLASNKNMYKVGDSVPVKIIVDTGKHKIAGADVIFSFDPKVLEATGSGAIAKGIAFKDYPFTEIDTKKGIVTISGISSINSNGITGTFTLAIVNFKAKTAGNSALAIIFEDGSTTDTNLVESVTNKDILKKVENLEVTIK